MKIQQASGKLEEEKSGTEQYYIINDE